MKVATNPKLFRDAADRVRRGWTQGTLHAYDGIDYWNNSGPHYYNEKVCLVGSLVIPDGRRNLRVNERRLIQRELRRYPTYWVSRVLQHTFASGTQDRAIEGWNDVIWRRQSTVVKVLERTATHVEKEWFQDQESKLRIRVAQLTAERDALKRKVARLEAQNRNLWHRVMARHDVEVDKEALAKLDAEMSDAMKKLELL